MVAASLNAYNIYKHQLHNFLLVCMILDFRRNRVIVRSLTLHNMVEF